MLYRSESMGNDNYGFFTYEGGQKAAEKLLQNKKISAIFCADDTMAFG